MYLTGPLSTLFFDAFLWIPERESALKPDGARDCRKIGDKSFMASHLVPRRFRPAHLTLPQHILLVEDDPADLRRFREITAGMDPGVDLVHTACLDDALERLDGHQFDAIFISVSADAGSVRRVLEHTVDAPIVVVTSRTNDSLVLQALQAGADDYLVKEDLNRDTLRNVLQCAIARGIWRSHIYALSLIDDLTELYNRRGFMTLGEQQLKIAHRTGAGVNLAFADLDALKFINDNFGHSEGDRALRDMATILKIAFHRGSDLIARIGGDEFAVLWIANPSLSADTARMRLKSALDSYKNAAKLPYPLSVSIGLCQYHPDFSNPLTEMLSEGDRRMYEEKSRSKTSVA
jgi:two-component system cell cycle response regulator